MKCENNVAYLCNGHVYEEWQDCNALSEVCVYNEPAVSGGYFDLAVCVDQDQI